MVIAMSMVVVIVVIIVGKLQEPPVALSGMAVLAFILCMRILGGRVGPHRVGDSTAASPEQCSVVAPRVRERRGMMSQNHGRCRWMHGGHMPEFQKDSKESLVESHRCHSIRSARTETMFDMPHVRGGPGYLRGRTCGGGGAVDVSHLNPVRASNDSSCRVQRHRPRHRLADHRVGLGARAVRQR